MVECTGKSTIPPALIATVTVIIVLCITLLVVVCKKGWLHYELVTPDMMQTSHKVSTAALGTYRILVALYSLGIIVWNVLTAEEEHKRVKWDMRFYTAWGYTTFCALFFLLSIQHIFTYTPHWISNFTWSMFHVALSTALFLDLVFWSILWAQVGGNEEMPGFFSVLNVHAINSVLLLGEVFLGKLQMVPAQIAWVLMYTVAYILMTWIDISVTDDCVPYSFLEVGPDIAPAWYVGMVAFLSTVYFLTYKCVQLKERLFMSASSQSGYESIA
eukprot:m.11683 g.11683  ORF g.11683 m.11683 type:complete len:272 (-) comp7485_c0_seq1:96-911(-)